MNLKVNTGSSMSLRRHSVINAWFALAAAILWLNAKPAHATSICVGGGIGEMSKTCTLDHTRSDGVKLSAEAQFMLSYSGSKSLLTLKLSNTASDPTKALDQILQAFFFDLADGITLSLLDPDGSGPRSSAEVSAGSKLVNFTSSNCNTPCLGTAQTSTSLVNKWQLKSGITNDKTMGGTFGVGAAGLDIFNGLNGPDYGLISALGLQNSGGGNWGTTQSPFVRNSATFTFKMAKAGSSNWRPGDISQLNIDKVSYNYGTNLNPIPEPGTIALMGLGLAGIGLMARRRRPA